MTDVIFVVIVVPYSVCTGEQYSTYSKLIAPFQS